MQKNSHYKIGPWTVDENSSRLTRAGREVPLEPRAMSTLLYLLRHRGRTVSREELLEHVWGKRALTDHAISVVIASLRQALDDDARDPRYLKTFRKKGYCLVDDETATAQADADRQAECARAGRSLSSRDWRWIACFVALLVALSLFRTGDTSDQARPSNTAIVLAPLQGALGHEIDQGRLSVVNDLLLMELSRYGNVHAAGTASDQAGVRVSGEVSKLDGALKISLAVAPDGHETTGYSEPSRDEVAYLAKAVRALVSNAFAGQLSGEAEEPFRSGQDILLDRARYLWGFHRDDRNQLAYRMVKRLLQEEPRNAEAHALLAEMYAALSGVAWGLEGVNTFELAEQHIQRAAELGASPKYIWRTRARIAHERDQDVALATMLYRKTLEADPNDYWSWRSMAVALALNEQFDDALDAHDKALSLALEPTGALSEKMTTLYFAGRFQEAAELQETLEHLDGRKDVRAALIPFMAGDHAKAFRNWQVYFVKMGREDLAQVIGAWRERDTVQQTYLQLVHKTGASEQPFPPLLKAYLFLAANDVGAATETLATELDKHRRQLSEPGYDRRAGRRFMIMRIDPILKRFEQQQQVRDLLALMHA